MARAKSNEMPVLSTLKNKREPRRSIESLTARVTEEIRNSIMKAEYRLGEILSEIRLAEKYGVSRTPIREALTELQRQGLIVIRPQSGSFVFKPTDEDVAELCEFRRMIEVAAIRLSHARRPQETIAQFHAAIETMTQSLERDNRLSYSDSDSAFHQAAVNNCANRYLIEAYKLVSGRLDTIRAHNLTNWEKLRKKITAEHKNIAAAFEKDNLLKVEEILDRHISRMISTFRIARRKAEYRRAKLKAGRKEAK